MLIDVFDRLVQLGKGTAARNGLEPVGNVVGAGEDSERARHRQGCRFVHRANGELGILVALIGPHDNHGSALTAQSGRSHGRPATNTGSQLIVQIGLPTDMLAGV
jgi:hypothetical protein